MYKRQIFSLSLTICVLILNAGISNLIFSLTSLGIGGLLLIYACVHGHNRIENAVIWIGTFILFGFMGHFALNGNIHALIDIGARICCGIIWILWLGTQVDWGILRALLLFLRIPKSIVSALDHGLLHAVFTQREWSCRRNSVCLLYTSPSPRD